MSCGVKVHNSTTHDLLYEQVMEKIIILVFLYYDIYIYIYIYICNQCDVITNT